MQCICAATKGVFDQESHLLAAEFLWGELYKLCCGNQLEKYSVTKLCSAHCQWKNIHLCCSLLSELLSYRNLDVGECAPEIRTWAFNIYLHKYLLGSVDMIFYFTSYSLFFFVFFFHGNLLLLVQDVFLRL